MQVYDKIYGNYHITSWVWEEFYNEEVIFSFASGIIGNKKIF